MPLRIACLGQLSLQRDGAVLSGAGTQPRRLAMLAVLAHAGERGVSRDRLVALLWPDADEERARRGVTQALYALRQELGSEDAIAGTKDLRLDPELVGSDLDQFRRAASAREWARAAAAWGGPFLDGFTLPGAPEFERWADEERAALAHEYAQVLEQAAEAEAKSGDYARAAAWWRRLAAHDPFNARVAMRLMHSLAEAGDRAGAIRHAAIYQALVEQELEMGADPAVQELADALRKAPARGPSPAPAPSPTPAPAPASEQSAPVTSADEPARAPAPPRGARPVRRFPAAWLTAAVLALIALGLFTAVRLRRARAVSLDGARVIVAPLENRTGDAELDLVGTMVAEWVTQGVARSGLVEVVDSRTMLFSAREVERPGSPQYLSALAEETGAGIVVSGSYYREGDSLRFQTSIVDPRGGSVRQSVDVVTAPAGRPTEALEPLRERIMGALAVLLDARLNNPAVASSQPPTFEAYRHFLLGMQAFGSDFESDYSHFIRAAQLDTGYAQAQLWAGIASANLRRYPRADSLLSRLDSLRDRLAPYDQANLEYFHRGFVRGEWQRSHAGAVRMLQLAPDAGHAAYAVGLTAAIRNRPREALDALLKIDLDRGWGRSWEQQVVNLVARSYHLLGRHEPELEWARRLRRSDPTQGWVRIPEARALGALGRLEELDQRLEESLAYPPNARAWEPFSPGELALAAARELAAHGHTEAAARVTARAVSWHLGRAESERAVPAERRALARALVAAGRLGEARRIHEQAAVDSASEPERLGTLGVIAAREGRAADARRLSDSLAALSTRYLFGSPSYWRARIAARSGHPDEAVRLLRQALSEGMGRFYLIHSEPDLQPLRGHGGFEALLTP